MTSEPPARAKGDQFAKVPQRVFTALRDGELTPAAFHVLVCLIGAIERNYRQGSANFTVRQLAEEMRWTYSRSHLTKILSELRRRSWIDFSAQPGQRRPITFRLVAASVGGQSEVTSHLSEVEAAAIPFESPSETGRRLRMVQGK